MELLEKDCKMLVINLNDVLFDRNATYSYVAP